jgi:transcriptional regulator with XRE-family HTH domain
MSTSFAEIAQIRRSDLARNGLRPHDDAMWHKKLKAAFGMLGVSVASLAREFDAHPNTIHNYLSGRTHPDLDTFWALCQRANVPPAWVLDDTIPIFPVVVESPTPRASGVIRVRDLPPPKAASAVKAQGKHKGPAKAPGAPVAAPKRSGVATPRPRRGK